MRPTDPEMKKVLLEKCFSVYLKQGAIDLSINSLGTKIGSSGRMLVYHFKSKGKLEELISKEVEQKLRSKFHEFSVVSSNENFFLGLWDYVVGDKELNSLIRLCYEFANSRLTPQEFSKNIDEQTEEWIKTFIPHFKSERIACVAYYAFSGALVHFLATGNSSHGRQALESFYQLGLVDTQLSIPKKIKS